MSTNKELNKEQKEIISNLDGVNLVVAGPGTGKTTTIQYYLAELVRNKIKPEEILAVTFTKKAANEMKKRVKNMHVENINISTIHSFAAGLLRKFPPPGYHRDFTIIDESREFAITSELIKKLDITEHPSFVLERLTLSRNLRDRKMLAKDGLKKFYHHYMKKLMQEKLMDYDGLLTWCCYVLENNIKALDYCHQKLNHIIVDEFQDVSPIQYKIIYELVKNSKNLLCVGDFDQAIFSFRGSDVSIMLNLEKDFPDSKIFFLEENYRSTEKIVKAANRLIKNNYNRKDKLLKSNRKEGINPLVRVFEDETQEAIFVIKCIKEGIKRGLKYSDFAVLYRVNVLSRIFEAIFSKCNIPYQVLGGTGFFERKEIKNILAFYYLMLDYNDLKALNKVIHLFMKCTGIHGIDFTTTIIPDFIKELKKEENLVRVYEKILAETGYLKYLKKDKSLAGEKIIENVEELKSVLVSFANEGKGIEEFIEFVENTNAEEDNNSVKLMTAHTAKGLEFDTVFIVGAESTLFPHYNSETKDALEEERRLFYVAMTRAENELYISYPKTKVHKGSIKKLKPSPFIKEIAERNFSIANFFNKDKNTNVNQKPSKSSLHKENIKEGSIVLHPLFGKGCITSIAQLEESRTLIEVKFYLGETKTLILEYADLTLLT